MTTSGTASTLVYVGTYTHSLPHVQGQARGIDVYRLDAASGALTFAHTREGIANPSYLTLDPHRRCLYSVAECAEGQVHAFRIDPATGALTALNHQSSQGSEPAHISVDRDGRWVLVANYGSGILAVLPIQEDGSLGPATDMVQHTGQGAHPERQAGPHAHWIGTDPANRFVLVADLGLDAIVSYRLEATSGTLVRTGACTMQPGAGPRHLAFRPDGRYVYVLNELNSTLVACAYDATSGGVHPLQSLSTLPAQFTGANWTAAVRVAPSGRFVYASNRGHDSIAIFASDPATGLLSYVGHTATQGREPRDFNIDPTGTFLLVANQNSDTILTFRLDAATGGMSATGQVSAARTPSCIAFGPVL
jgi:6-phosphogluconolactonase